ncbi:MAG: hypothetical protein ACFB21_00380 [Opitutales bacterium]
MAQQPVIGIQVDWPSREGDLHAFCAKLKELASINRLVCWWGEHEVRWDNAAFQGMPWQPKETQTDSRGKTAFERLHEACVAHDMELYLGGGEEHLKLPKPPEPLVPYMTVDCFGERTHITCVNNADWRAYHVAMNSEVLRQNDYLAGFMFMHERCGPMQQLLKPEVWQGHFTPGCFCPDCLKLAETRGLDADRAAAGMREMVSLFRDKPASARRDGFFTVFWRLMTRYPEVLAWENFQWESLHRFRADIANAQRAVRGGIDVGYHFQNCSHFGNLAWRAGDDPERVIEYADWLKPSIYPGVSGGRYRNTLRLYRKTMLADFTEEQAHQFVSATFLRGDHVGREALGEEAAAEKRQVAFGPDWCEIETRRIVEGGAPKPCYAGLGIGVPGGEQADNPKLLADCAHGCLDGGATGFIISRGTSEMPDDQLKAVGDVIRQRLL